MSDLPADSASGLWAWFPAAPIRVAGGLALALASVAAVDPAQGSLVPPCLFHTLTGWWCPGCGMTRATHRLLHGDVVGAIRYNVLLPFVVLLITLAWVDSYARSTGRRPVLAARLPRWAPALGVALAVAFAVVRNLPAAHFLRGGAR